MHVIHQLRIVPLVDFSGDLQCKVNREQELQLQRVHFTEGHATHLQLTQRDGERKEGAPIGTLLAHLCVESVVEVLVVKKLGGEHEAGDDDPVDVQGAEGHRVPLNQTIDEDKGQYEALRRATSVFQNAASGAGRER